MWYHNFSKFQSFITCNCIHIFDITWLSESYLKLQNMQLCQTCRSPSQTKDEFKNFIKNLALNLEHTGNKSPFLIVVLGDFNARIQDWYQKDKTTFEGPKVDLATSQFSLSQTIKEPTHILSNSVPCIDLIFTSQPNLVIYSGIHLTMHPNCHREIVFSKHEIILTIFYLPPYKQLVRHYQQANTDLIK